MSMTRPVIRKVLGRGLRKRCPHCGQSPLFSRWITALDRCPVCGYVYLRNAGDTWLFWIIGDRIPLLIAIVLIYFGFVPRGWWMSSAAVLAIVIPLVVSMPYRQGLAIAINYLSRVYMPDRPGDIPGEWKG